MRQSVVLYTLLFVAATFHVHALAALITPRDPALDLAHTSVGQPIVGESTSTFFVPGTDQGLVVVVPGVQLAVHALRSPPYIEIVNQSSASVAFNVTVPSGCISIAHAEVVRVLGTAAQLYVGCGLVNLGYSIPLTAGGQQTSSPGGTLQSALAPSWQLQLPSTVVADSRAAVTYTTVSGSALTDGRYVLVTANSSMIPNSTVAPAIAMMDALSGQVLWSQPFPAAAPQWVRSECIVVNATNTVCITFVPPSRFEARTASDGSVIVATEFTTISEVPDLHDGRFVLPQWGSIDATTLPFALLIRGRAAIIGAINIDAGSMSGPFVRQSTLSSQAPQALEFVQPGLFGDASDTSGMPRQEIVYVSGRNLFYAWLDPVTAAINPYTGAIDNLLATFFCTDCDGSAGQYVSVDELSVVALHNATNRGQIILRFAPVSTAAALINTTGGDADTWFPFTASMVAVRDDVSNSVALETTPGEPGVWSSAMASQLRSNPQAFMAFSTACGSLLSSDGFNGRVQTTPLVDDIRLNTTALANTSQSGSQTRRLIPLCGTHFMTVASDRVPAVLLLDPTAGAVVAAPLIVTPRSSTKQVTSATDSNHWKRVAIWTDAGALQASDLAASAVAAVDLRAVATRRVAPRTSASLGSERPFSITTAVTNNQYRYPVTVVHTAAVDNSQLIADAAFESSLWLSTAPFSPHGVAELARSQQRALGDVLATGTVAGRTTLVYTVYRPSASVCLRLRTAVVAPDLLDECFDRFTGDKVLVTPDAKIVLWGMGTATVVAVSLSPSVRVHNTTVQGNVSAVSADTSAVFIGSGASVTAWSPGGDSDIRWVYTAPTTASNAVVLSLLASHHRVYASGGGALFPITGGNGSAAANGTISNATSNATSPDTTAAAPSIELVESLGVCVRNVGFITLNTSTGQQIAAMGVHCGEFLATNSESFFVNARDVAGAVILDNSTVTDHWLVGVNSDPSAFPTQARLPFTSAQSVKGTVAVDRVAVLDFVDNNLRHVIGIDVQLGRASWVTVEAPPVAIVGFTTADQLVYVVRRKTVAAGPQDQMQHATFVEVRNMFSGDVLFTLPSRPMPGRLQDILGNGTLSNTLSALRAPQGCAALALPLVDASGIVVFECVPVDEIRRQEESVVVITAPPTATGAPTPPPTTEPVNFVDDTPSPPRVDSSAPGAASALVAVMLSCVVAAIASHV